MQLRDNEELSITELARIMEVSPSFVSQLVKKRRIPEARRDPETNRYRIPNRPCIVRGKTRRKNAKIDRFYMTPSEERAMHMRLNQPEEDSSGGEKGSSLPQNLSKDSVHTYMEKVEEALILLEKAHYEEGDVKVELSIVFS